MRTTTTRLGRQQHVHCRLLGCEELWGQHQEEEQEDDDTHHRLPSYEDLWAQQQQQDQDDNDTCIVIFLAMKTYQHSSKKKTRKMTTCTLSSSLLWRLVSTIIRKWQHTCIIIFLVVKTYEHSSKKKTRKMTMPVSLSLWLWGPVSITTKRKLRRGWHVCCHLPSYEDLRTHQ